MRIIALFAMSLAFAIAHAEQPVRLFAAGSLRAALNDVIAAGRAGVVAAFALPGRLVARSGRRASALG